MSAHVSTHALERAIRQTSHGAIRSLGERQAQLGYDQLQEIEQQIQIPISGVASSGVGWTMFTVGFDVEFFFAPNQRDIPFSIPHFMSGAVVQGEPVVSPADPNNPDSLVAVFCHVIDWSIDTKTAAINGAAVGVGVSVIGGQDVSFDGYLHLTFQGFGSPSENIPQLDIGQ